jgi:hypothetical protein
VIPIVPDNYSVMDCTDDVACPHPYSAPHRQTQHMADREPEAVPYEVESDQLEL